MEGAGKRLRGDALGCAAATFVLTPGRYARTEWAGGRKRGLQTAAATVMWRARFEQPLARGADSRSLSEVLACAPDPIKQINTPTRRRTNQGESAVISDLATRFQNERAFSGRIWRTIRAVKPSAREMLNYPRRRERVPAISRRACSACST